MVGRANDAKLTLHKSRDRSLEPVRIASAFFQALSVLHGQRSLSGKALWIAVAAMVAWAMPTLIWFNELTMSPAA